MKYSLVIVGAIALTACSQSPPEVKVSTTVNPAAGMPAQEADQAKVRDTATITVAAIGQVAARTWPTFAVLVNGEKIGEATASSDRLQHFSFETGRKLDNIREVSVRYLNDAVLEASHREDRNLFVPYIELNGETLHPMTYATYVREGGQMERGTEYMYWNGDLVFTVVPAITEAKR